MKGRLISLVCMVLLMGLVAGAEAYSIRDDATGGDCTLIGSWDAVTKTCTLSVDISSIGSVGVSIDANGITLDGNNHVITGLRNNDVGIYVSGKERLNIKNIAVDNFDKGIILTGSNYIKISYSSITNCSTDNINILNNSSYNVLHDNLISSAIYRGVYIGHYSSNNILANNIISYNNYWHSTSNIGILMYQHANNNKIINNILSYNTYPIRIMDYSDNNLVYNNDFIDNEVLAQVTSWSYGNQFNLEQPIGGNYWNHYDTPAEGCEDQNVDGFCDSPYELMGNIIISDNLPWTIQSGYWVDADLDGFAIRGGPRNSDSYIRCKIAV